MQLERILSQLSLFKNVQSAASDSTTQQLAGRPSKCARRTLNACTHRIAHLLCTERLCEHVRSCTSSRKLQNASQLLAMLCCSVTLCMSLLYHKQGMHLLAALAYSATGQIILLAMSACHHCVTSIACTCLMLCSVLQQSCIAHTNDVTNTAFAAIKSVFGSMTS